MRMLNRGCTVPVCTDVVKSSVVNKHDKQQMQKLMCLCDIRSSYV